MSALPDDVHPDSRCRLPLARRDALDERGQAVFDHLTDARTTSLVGLPGPTGIRLHSPEVAHHLHALLGYFRRRSPLPATLREIAILATAREHDSRFEWAAHESEALRVGVASDVIDVIRHGGATDGLPDAERAVIEVARQLFRERRLGQALYARALALFGTVALLDLVSLMGHYAATACLLTAFDMQLPPDCSVDLPDTVEGTPQRPA
jgi:4-carboxymuconolactone decarboxylase